MYAKHFLRTALNWNCVRSEPFSWIRKFCSNQDLYSINLQITLTGQITFVPKEGRSIHSPLPSWSILDLDMKILTEPSETTTWSCFSPVDTCLFLGISSDIRRASKNANTNAALKRKASYVEKQNAHVASHSLSKREIEMGFLLSGVKLLLLYPLRAWRTLKNCCKLGDP